MPMGASGVNVTGAWGELGGFGSAGVVVAILDTGVDFNQPELEGRLMRIGAVPGINVVAPGLPPQDGHGHGPAMVGVVGAAIDSGQGMAGLSRATILYVKVCNPGCRADHAAIGIASATNHGAHVMSMSFGAAYDPLLERATNSSAARGVLMVAAADNVPTRPVVWPAALPHVGAIATVNSTNVSKASASGPEIELAAPGGNRTQDYRDIFTTLPGAAYGHAAASSVTTAHVAGGAALTLSADRSMGAAELRGILKATAHPLTLLPDGTTSSSPNGHYGHGLLDVGAAVTMARS